MRKIKHFYLNLNNFPGKTPGPPYLLGAIPYPPDSRIQKIQMDALLVRNYNVVFFKHVYVVFPTERKKHARLIVTMAVNTMS